ncbi:MlaD family protein [Spirillospora sp. NPDC047279]|uniref:MlaD family protein n=1 Tax=Spirillospora sp. NPDC047279 TaxID=3155478 RepID=UPI0033FB3F7F
MSEEPLSNRSRTAFGLVGAGVIAAAAVFVVLGSQQGTAGSTYYSATFGRAGQGLDPGKSDVKIRGITVGTVETVKLDKAGKVSVRMRVDKGIRVADTSSARIEPVSVFGPKDLVLELGAHELTGPYLSNGGTVAQTTDPQELSDTAWPAYRLTKAINPDEVAAIVHTFGAGLSGQGPALRRTIDNGGKVIDAAHANRAVIQSLINDIGLLGGTVGGKGGTIVRFTGDFNDLAPALNGNPDKVSQLLDEGGELADRVGTFTAQHGNNLSSVIDGGGDVISVMARQRRNIPLLIDSVNGFFALLSQVIRVPGPEGSLLAQARAPLPLDLCGIFVDVCPQEPKQTAFQIKTDPDADPRAGNTPRNGTTNGTGARP